MTHLCSNAESDLPYNGAIISNEEVASVVAIDPYDPSYHPGPFSEIVAL